MAPEDNPTDDVQPTEAEWDAYERERAASGYADAYPGNLDCGECGGRTTVFNPAVGAVEACRTCNTKGA